MRGEIAADGGREIALKAESGVRYTVPVTVHPDRVADKVTVRFRVGDVYKDAFVSVYFDGERVQHKKKRVIAPGEMEQIVLTRKQLDENHELKTITVKIEDN